MAKSLSERLSEFVTSAASSTSVSDHLTRDGPHMGTVDQADGEVAVRAGGVVDECNCDEAIKNVSDC